MKSEIPNPEPGPRRIVHIDVEKPLPTLSADARYHAAMVVARRSGVPCGAVDLDLDAGAERINARLQTLVTDGARLPSAGAVAGPNAGPEVHREVGRRSLPGISVVIPTIVSRVQDLALLLDGLAVASYPGVEILLVDNRPTVPRLDPLPALVAGHPEVRVIRAEQPGISAARNAGIEAARHDIVAFTDDDVRVDPDWLSAIARRFSADPSLDAVTGLILPAELETPSQIWFERYYGGFGGRRNFTPVTVRAEQDSGRLRHSRATVRDESGTVVRRFSIYGVGAYGAGANMAFRRQALRRHGMFDTSLGTGTPARGGEDLAMLVDILWAGGRIGFEPAAVVNHRHRREWPQLVDQLRGNGLGFTAMLTAAVLADRRHLLSLTGQIPLATRRMLAQSVARLAGRGPGPQERDVDQSFPRQLLLSELRGYPSGPAAYVRSRRVNHAAGGRRRWEQIPDVARAGSR